MIRVYLKQEKVPQEVVQELDKNERKENYHRDEAVYRGQKYKRDGNGVYIVVEYYDDGLPRSITDEMVREVSLRADIISAGGPPENGKYSHASAHAIVELMNEPTRVSDGQGDWEWEDKVVQKVRIHGSNFQDVAVLYEAIRENKKPDTSWDKHMPKKKAAEAADK